MAYTIEALNQTSGPHSGSGATEVEVTVNSGPSLVLLLVSSATASDNHGTPTLEGVNFTKVESTFTGTQRCVDLWYIPNISAGTWTLRVAPSSISNRYSYGWAVVNGVKTSSPLNASAAGGTATGTSRTGTVNATVANCLTILVNYNLYTAGTNSTKTFGTGDDANMFHNTADKASGNFSMTATSSSAENKFVIAAFEPGGTEYTTTLTESLTPTDSVIKTPARSLSESKTATDDVLAAPARTLSESSTPTDSFVSAFIILETLTEAVSAIDSMIRSGIRTLTESITATATFIQESVRSLLESITASDTFAAILTYGRNLTESITATDTIRKVLNGSSTIWNSLTKIAGSWANQGKNLGSWINRDKI